MYLFCLILYSQNIESIRRSNYLFILFGIYAAVQLSCLNLCELNPELKPWTPEWTLTHAEQLNFKDIILSIILNFKTIELQVPGDFIWFYYCYFNVNSFFGGRLCHTVVLNFYKYVIININIINRTWVYLRKRPRGGKGKTIEMRSGNKGLGIPLCPSENVGACKNDHLRTCGIVCISS